MGKHSTSDPEQPTTGEILAGATTSSVQRMRARAALLRADTGRVGLGGEALPPPEEWVNSEFHVGHLVESLWPANKRFVIEACKGKYKKIIYRGSIGCGKTTANNVVMVRKIQEVLSDPNFKRKIGISPTSKISILYLSVTKEKAKETGFDDLRELIATIPFFQREGFQPDPKYKDSLRFKRQNLFVLPIVASKTGVISWNAIAAFLDEGNFGRVVEQSKLARGVTRTYDQMAETCGELERRIDSRFMTRDRYYGCLQLASSSQYPGDFIERECLEAEKRGDVGTNTLVVSMPLWEAKRGVIDKTTGEPVYSDETTPEGGFSVEIGDEQTVSRILEPGQQPRKIEDAEGELRDARVIRVPIEFKPRFERGIEGALRDIAGEAVLTRTVFIGDAKALGASVRLPGAQCASDCRCETCAAATHPFVNARGERVWQTCFAEGERLDTELIAVQDPETREYRPRKNPDAWRFIAVDPAVDGPAGLGDALGLAMGHVSGCRPVVRPLASGEREMGLALDVYIDFALRVVRDPSEPYIRWDPIVDLFLQLRRLGFLIGEVTTDSFQTAHFLERLHLNGFAAEKMSVDTSIDPYTSLRDAIVERRWSIYAYPIAQMELAELEYDALRKKVDHPKGNARGRKPSKDVADALAACTHRAISRYLEYASSSADAGAAVVGVQERARDHVARLGNGLVSPPQMPMRIPAGLAAALRPTMPMGAGGQERQWRPGRP